MSNVDDEFRAQILEALRRLQAGLQESATAKKPRDSAIISLKVVVEFVNSLEWMREQGLSAPLLNLQWALQNLSQGIIAPILKPSPEERKRNRGGHSTFRQINQALAVFCSDLLLDDGLSLEAGM